MAKSRDVPKRNFKRFDFLSLAKERKSTYEFSEKKVSENDLLKILEAGRWAPSCSNHQPWKFVVVTDQKIIDELVSICNFGVYHQNPPLIIAFIIEACSEEESICMMGKYDDYICIGQPALNMIYEATVLGIASCYLSPTKIKAEKILKIPKDTKVAIMVGFGYEKKGAFQKVRTRKPLKELVFRKI